LLCVLVLPLPRSGSSMVAGILDQLGVDMGPCRPPDAANPLGYFEDVRFWWLHRYWSRRYETIPGRARLRLPAWDPPLSEVDLRRYARLVRACEQRPQWGAKDPEFCYYAARFAALLRRPFRTIATTRATAAAAASLAAARHFTPADGDRVIREYADRQALMLAELESHGIPPALAVDYDAALADPEGTVRRIAAHVDLPVTAAATAFVAPRLRRHGRPADTPRNDDQGVTTSTM
jgi:hypothetical protein